MDPDIEMHLVNQYDDAAADAYGFEHRRLREWAPLVGNGAAMLAVANIVANAANQDAALDGLTAPLGFFAAGLCCGLSATHWIGIAFNSQTTITREWRELHTLSVKASEASRRMNQTRLPSDEDTIAAYASKASASKPIIATSLGRFRRAYKVARLLSLSSILCCGIGFLYLLIGHHLGFYRLG